jgi:prepilin-type processing-associated H-X9-DG protein
MAAHDMSPDNWPPGPDSRTGIGLWWDNRTVSLLLGAEAMQKPELLAGVKLSVVPAPADTVVLTEFIDPNNNLGGIQQASVIGAASQLAFFKGTGAHFHRGRFNYLMVDGHVERWSPLQSGALNSSAGIWSLQKEN